MPDLRPRKRIRLDLDRYADHGSTWHVATNTRDQLPVLTTQGMAEIVVDALRFQCAKANADLLLYCVMPDHLHLVVTIADTDLVAIMRDVKSWTTRQWTRQTGQTHLWQESFYDHGVRRTERMDTLVAYVVGNPVKAGLVTEWQAYPWLGGILLEEP
jgi:putative transposase